MKVKANGRGPFVFEADTGSMTSPLSSQLANEMEVNKSDSTNSRSVLINLTNGQRANASGFRIFFRALALTGRRIYAAAHCQPKLT